MTEKAKENSLVLRSEAMPPVADMPRPGKSEVLEAQLEPLTRVEHRVRAGCHASNLEDIQQAVDLAERFTANPGFEDLRYWLGTASRPATKDQISKCMAGLIACYPANREPIFGRILSEDVGTLRPSIGALDSACRSLRRQSKFLPAIAEVMEAVQLADGRIRQANRNIAQIPKCLDEAKANLRLRIERREQQEQLREQEEQLRKEQIALEEEYERYWQENGRPHPDAPSVL